MKVADQDWEEVIWCNFRGKDFSVSRARGE